MYRHNYEHFRGGMVQQRTVPRAAGVRVGARSLPFSACIFAGMTNLHLLFAASETVTSMPIVWAHWPRSIIALSSPRAPGLSSPPEFVCNSTHQHTTVSIPGRQEEASAIYTCLRLTVTPVQRFFLCMHECRTGQFIFYQHCQLICNASHN